MKNAEATAWSEAAFAASLIGVRAAVQRAMADLRSVARAGGNVEGARRALLAALPDLDRGCARLLLSATAATPTCMHEPPPRSVDPIPATGGMLGELTP
ncbi:hypothetical protein [Neoroseomonas lacus]|uniref:Uncharacterized protein n=1 Tax=Neoroseomonas lacus TaxID=287609 RepID=A0A917KQX0_9PROT|nr:hypothetical protein [Neoroseomonas lacus]GGJ22666.1 hypothetical protein GCM10011320_32380 [Neoroseomonas lacus]